jgi:hypothetical protein
MEPVSNRTGSISISPAEENIPAVPANSSASPPRESWLRAGRCQPEALESLQNIERTPRHNARRHLGSGFLHGVGRHVQPRTPGGNPAWGNPRCCRQDQSRSGQDQIWSELLGLVPLLGWNRQGTVRFVERGGAESPASDWNELGTWPTSHRPQVFALVSPMSSCFLSFLRP